MRRLPHQGARHSTVDHGDASDGVFLLPSPLGVLAGPRRPPSLVVASFELSDHPWEWSPSLSSLWTTSRANGSLPANGSASTCLGLTHPHTQETGDRTASGMGQVGQPGPTDPGPFQPGSVASLRTWVLLSLCTLPPPFAPFLTMSFSCLWWRVFSLEVWSFTLQSFGMSLCNTSVLATFGCDFMKLSNMNETPQLLLWTCYDSVLYVHVFLQKRNTSKYTYKDELVISLLCLVAGQFHNKIQTKV
jgi:hypothetical protein